MDESVLVEPIDDPGGHLARQAALIRECAALEFDNRQLRAAALDLARAVERMRSVLLDTGLAVAREAHRDQERRAHWMSVLREINSLL